MWRSKMAARWRGEDGALNTGGGAFLTGNTPAELVLCGGHVDGVDMDTQSCVDHSILAIFEDSTVASESKMGAEESETLLSALTEMLDSVEDDDQTLSPFDTLPDTKLLNHTELRDTSVELSLAHRLRPRIKPPNVTFMIKGDGEKDQESKEEKHNMSQIFNKPSQVLFQPKTKKAEPEVEVFTSTSLVSLVRIMHPYCLKLHVEEGGGDKVGQNHTIFSQEEVWKYERPTEESDEEINVVSDDEAPAKQTKEEDGKRDSGLKSALLKRKSPRAAASREKKRVSFGSVQVASFDDSVEEKPNEKNLTSEGEPLNSTKALQSPADSALEPRASSETSCDKAEVGTPKGETKAKSLSLQQYRQLRQKRLPLVEQQGNYTTKWPSVPEAPKELPPILCLQGQKHPSCRSKTTRHYTEIHKPDYKTSSPHVPQNPSEAKPSTRTGLKRPRSESKVVSAASRLPDATANPNVTVLESKKSPVKRPTVFSSDPPNPVLLPLPLLQTPPPSTSGPKVEFRDSSLQEIQSEPSAASLSQPKRQTSSLNADIVSLIQEIKAKFTETTPDVSSASPAETQSAPERTNLQPQNRSPTKETNSPPKIIPSSSPDSVKPAENPSSQLLSPPDVPTASQKELPDVPHSVRPPVEPASPAASCKGQSATIDSGIEAPDLTSLLEQFEETQAKEEIVCETKPGHFDLHTTQAVVSDKTSTTLQPSVEPADALSASETPVTQNALRDLPDIQTLDIPEPLCPEIILSSQQELPARWKNPPSKAIQIIDPRPLPPRRTHTDPPAAQTDPHIYSYICSDHDYCVPMDHSNVNTSQRSKVKDVSTTTTEQQAVIQDSNAAVERRKQISAKSEQTRSRSEEKPSTEAALQFSEEDGGFSENTKPQCTLPTPPPSPPPRGRDRRRYRRRSPRSDSSSSSCSSSSSSSSSSSASRSPKRRRLHHKRSESSSCSSSPSYSVSRSPPRGYRLSYSRSRYSRSRSRSWSQSRSPSPQMCCRRWRDVCSSRESRRLRREHEIRIQKLKAIDERRVVYVGRIRRSMTHDELRERFSQIGEVECVSLHFRDRGDHYGFVTFYTMEDAFAAIDNGGKLRKPDELPFDICFGGRRQFCNSDYADLDANRDAEAASPTKSRFEDLDFDSLLKQAQRGLKR